MKTVICRQDVELFTYLKISYVTIFLHANMAEKPPEAIQIFAFRFDYRNNLHSYWKLSTNQTQI